jgi:hypothetical protein
MKVAEEVWLLEVSHSRLEFNKRHKIFRFSQVRYSYRRVEIDF